MFFCQSCRRKIPDLWLKRFRENFAIASKFIPSLAFIPLAEVIEAFKLVAEETYHLFKNSKADTSILDKPRLSHFWKKSVQFDQSKSQPFEDQDRQCKSW